MYSFPCLDHQKEFFGPYSVSSGFQPGYGEGDATTPLDANPWLPPLPVDSSHFLGSG